MLLRTIAISQFNALENKKFLHFLLTRYLRFMSILEILEGKTSCCEYYISFPEVLTREDSKKVIISDKKYNLINIHYERSSFPFQILVLTFGYLRS